MATSFSDVFENFTDNITDPDILAFSKELKDEYLLALLKKAIAKSKMVFKDVDLTMEGMNFKEEIPDDVLDILSEWMIVFWLRPYLNNVDNLRNNLSTKDFTFFSPANLLDKITNLYKMERKNARSGMNQYSYLHSSMSNLKS